MSGMKKEGKENRNREGCDLAKDQARSRGVGMFTVIIVQFGLHLLSVSNPCFILGSSGRKAPEKIRTGLVLGLRGGPPDRRRESREIGRLRLTCHRARLIGKAGWRYPRSKGWERLHFSVIGKHIDRRRRRWILDCFAPITQPLSRALFKKPGAGLSSDGSGGRDRRR